MSSAKCSAMHAMHVSTCLPQSATWRLVRCVCRAAKEKKVLRKNPTLYKDHHAATAPPTTTRPLTKPEVLAPAGGWEQLRAAAENGANAVYFGVSNFNARARAENFDVDSLPDIVAFLHERGMKGYLVLNVLIFDDELVALARVAQAARRAGVDAVIVQDLGAVELIRRAAPGLAIHGSTQMTVTSVEGMEFARTRGMERVVVGRELSVADISEIADHTDLEIEAFVHGALCVSYSGQCFSSEAWGGRSANRGQCAQACRLPYGLIVDGELKDFAERYVLSPQDLAAVDLMPELIRAGIVSLKIEGRLKGPEYVAMTTSVYRRAVDTAWDALQAGRDVQPSELIDEQAWDDLRTVFSRAQDGAHDGLTHGFYGGSKHQTLVRGRNPRHRGLFVGEVVGVDDARNRLEIELVRGLKLGDGIVVDQGKPEELEVGGSIYEIYDERHVKLHEAPKGSVVAVALGAASGALQGRVKPGDLIFKNRDDALMSRLRSSFEAVAAKDRRRTGVGVELRVAVGEPLEIRVWRRGGDDGSVFSAFTESVVQVAANKPTTVKDLRKAVGVHLGDDGSLSLESFSVTTGGMELEETADQGVFVPMKEVKEARRRAVQALLGADRCRAASSSDLPDAQAVVDAMHDSIRHRRGVDDDDGAAADADAVHAAPRLRVLCRTPEQVAAAASVGWLEEIILDFLEVKGLQKAIALVKAADKRAVVAMPRILKPQEKHLWEFYLTLDADALLVRSTSAIQRFASLGGPGATVVVPHPNNGTDVTTTVPRLEGDFSLNATNSLTADLLLNQNLSTLALTFDCNSAQIADVLTRLGPQSANVEVIVHSNLPIFHTEHCLFARFLSDGDDYTNCGRPCESTTLHIRDPNGGKDHLVEADMGCRNTVFEASSQTALRYLHDFRDAGAGVFRLELVDQPAHVIPELLEGYRGVLAADTPNERRRAQSEHLAWMNEQLADANGRCFGVSEGSLAVKAEVDRRRMKKTASQKSREDRRGTVGGQNNKRP